MKIKIYDVRSDYQGFAHLIKIAERTRECVFDNIDIDMGNVTWLDANMCASFGAGCQWYNKNRHGSQLR